MAYTLRLESYNSFLNGTYVTYKEGIQRYKDGIQRGHKMCFNHEKTHRFRRRDMFRRYIFVGRRYLTCQLLHNWEQRGWELVLSHWCKAVSLLYGRTLHQLLVQWYWHWWFRHVTNSWSVIVSYVDLHARHVQRDKSVNVWDVCVPAGDRRIVWVYAELVYVTVTKLE